MCMIILIQNNNNNNIKQCEKIEKKTIHTNRRPSPIFKVDCKDENIIFIHIQWTKHKNQHE